MRHHEFLRRSRCRDSKNYHGRGLPRRNLHILSERVDSIRFECLGGILGMSPKQLSPSARADHPQIGRTSSLVMTLCGVLKDILLVFASVIIWGTPVTLLQYLGYGIALCGLIYFKLGGDTLKLQFSEMNRQWAEYGAKNPAKRKVMVFGIILLIIIVLLGGIAPGAGYDRKWLSSLLGQSTEPDKVS